MVRLLLMLVAFQGIGAAQNLACLKELMVPRYNLTARRSRSGGTVSVAVLIGEHGRPSRIDAVASNSDLADEVRFYLSNGTTYSEGCDGKVIDLQFTFELTGEPEWDPPVFVKFRPPNHFIIMSRPRKPDIDPPRR